MSACAGSCTTAVQSPTKLITMGKVTIPAQEGHWVVEYDTTPEIAITSVRYAMPSLIEEGKMVATRELKTSMAEEMLEWFRNTIEKIEEQNQMYQDLKRQEEQHFMEQYYASLMEQQEADWEESRL